MATFTHNKAWRALCKKLELLVFNPPIPIAYEDTTFPQPGAQKPDVYLEVTQHLNKTRQITFGTDPQQAMGFIQVSVYVKSGRGVTKSGEIAGSIINHFKGAVLFEEDCRITVMKEPDPATRFQEVDYIHLPITIEYQAFEKEA